MDDDAAKDKADEGFINGGSAMRIYVKSLKKQLDKIGKASLPTYVALYAEKDEVFRFLLETGLLTLNQCDDEHGRTCLHWALLHKRVDILMKLARAFNVMPSLSIKDATGETALQMAMEQHDEEAMEWFKEYVNKLFRERDVCVQALNGVLVGAALIASVTFANWFQLASSYDIPVESKGIKYLWGSNAVALISARLSLSACIFTLLPRSTIRDVGVVLKQVKRGLVCAAYLLTWSIMSLMFGLIYAPPSYQKTARTVSIDVAVIIILFLYIYRSIFLWLNFPHLEISPISMLEIEMVHC